MAIAMDESVRDYLVTHSPNFQRFVRKIALYITLYHNRITKSKNISSETRIIFISYANKRENIEITSFNL